MLACDFSIYEHDKYNIWMFEIKKYLYVYVCNWWNEENG